MPTRSVRDPIRIEKYLTRRLVEYPKVVKWFVCLFGCGVSLSKGRSSQLRGTACGGERPARKCRDTTRIENFLQRRFVECLKILEWFVRPAIR